MIHRGKFLIAYIQISLFAFEAESRRWDFSTVIDVSDSNWAADSSETSFLTVAPSTPPSRSPAPSMTKSSAPSLRPTISFSPTRSDSPSLNPTISTQPTISTAPSISRYPTQSPTTSAAPTLSRPPSAAPTNVASMYPSLLSSFQPTNVPSVAFSTAPSLHPSSSPSQLPPTSMPSSVPSSSPSSRALRVDYNGGCNRSEQLYMLILRDSAGDGWEGVDIKIFDMTTPFKYIFASTLQAGVSKEQIYLCLNPSACYGVIAKGYAVFSEETSWEVRPVVLGVIDESTGFPYTDVAIAKGGSPAQCQFSVPIESPDFFGDPTFSCNLTCLGMAQ